MNYFLKTCIFLVALLFIFAIPSYSLDLKNSPEDCTFIINNINDEQKKELAYYYRGQYYLDNGDFVKAISDFTESIKRAKTKGALEESYYYRGLAYFSMENYEKAIPDFTQAINYSADNPSNQAESYMYRGRSYLMSGNYSLAIKDSTNVIMKGYADKESWAHPAYYTRGMAYDQIKNYKNAIIDLSKFIQYEQNNLQDPLVVLQVGDAYFFRAQARVKSGVINSHYDVLNVFKELEKAISIYSISNDPAAIEKKNIVKQVLRELKATYYK